MTESLTPKLCILDNFKNGLKYQQNAIKQRNNIKLPTLFENKHDQVKF